MSSLSVPASEPSPSPRNSEKSGISGSDMMTLVFRIVGDLPTIRGVQQLLFFLFFFFSCFLDGAKDKRVGRCGNVSGSSRTSSLCEEIIYHSKKNSVNAAADSGAVTWSSDGTGMSMQRKHWARPSTGTPTVLSSNSSQKYLRRDPGEEVRDDR